MTLDSTARLQTMRDMFLYAQKLYSWCLTRDFELLYSNCPSQDFFFDMFCLSSCKDAAEKHFADKKSPAILVDGMGFGWIAAADSDNLHLLGPLFTVEASETYLRRLCSHMKLSDSLTSQLLTQIGLVTIIPMNTTIRYAIMLHYCVTGEPISAEETTVIIEPAELKEKDDWHTSTWHGTWQAEIAFFNSIKEGKMLSMSGVANDFSNGRVGTMSPGDPLRQAQDEAIVLSVLCSRAAILGGVSPEGSMNLADYYIQRIEASSRISDIRNCTNEMYETFVTRVQKAKKGSKFSPAISGAMEYIRTHVMEKVSLEEMARELGYSDYYLSSKFKKETGSTLNQYIRQEKIEVAKEMLMDGRLDAADISERLCFSSPSYFGATFKQITGMTPNEYQNHKGENQ